MSLYRHIIKDSRSMMLASASGLLFFSQFNPVWGQETLINSSRHSSMRGYVEPVLTKISSGDDHPLMSISEGRVTQIQHVQSQKADERVQRLYGSGSQTTTLTPPQTFNPVAAKPLPQSPQQLPTQQVQHTSQQPAVVSQTAASRVPRKSLYDRLVGKVRGTSDVPAGPPQDPGMKYPTVSGNATQRQQPNAQPRIVPPPAQTAVKTTTPANPPKAPAFVPPPVPGVGVSISDIAADPAAMDSAKPRLFPGTSSATPLSPQGITQESLVAQPPKLGTSFIPPMPDSDEYIQLNPAPAKSSGGNLSQGDSLISFPELKAIMEGNGEPPTEANVAEQFPTPHPQPKPAVVAKKGTKTLPVIDLDSSLPKLEAVLQHQKELNRQNAATASIKQTEIPESAIIVEENPGIVTTPANVERKPLPVASSSDPLANPFPADTQQDVTHDDLNLVFSKPVPKVEVQNVQPSEEAMKTPTPNTSIDEEELLAVDSEEAIEKPYTGLSLEEDLFLMTKSPAPAEPSTMVGTTTKAVTSTKTITDQSLTDQTDAPGFASLDLPPTPELPMLPVPTGRSVVQESPKLEEKSLTEENSSDDSESLTPSREIPRLQAPQVENRVALNVPELKPQKTIAPPKDARQSKLELIASRKGLSGLKGFCPVELRDARNLVDAKEIFTAVFNEKEYTLSSQASLHKFLADPEMYAPAMRGSDVIHLSLTGEEVEGSLDHAVWYKGRLYLFTSAETMETFVAAPSSHSTQL